MKKVLCILLLTAMLFGCGEIKNNENSLASSPKESITVAPTEEQTLAPDVSEETIERYENLSDFKNSSFYKRISEEGAVPYLLEYDENMFTLNFINCEASWYSYCFKENTTNKYVTVSLTYNTTTPDINSIQEKFNSTGSVVTTAERNGITYDIFLNKTPYVEYENYDIIYNPVEGYRVSIGVEDTASQDEILTYFDDFELVSGT